MKENISLAIIVTFGILIWTGMWLYAGYKIGYMRGRVTRRKRE